MSPSSQLSLDVDRLIDARPETVFRLLTEPDLYPRWFGPVGATVTVREMTVTLGGRLELEISHPALDGPVTIEAFYEVIEPPVRLVHTWRAGDEELVTVVSFELEPRGDRTHLAIHHRGFVDPVDLEQNQHGWLDHVAALGHLAAELERASP